MMSSSASTSRTCPACGARNSGISLFCAECGSSLNADVDRTGDTTAIPIQPSASQHTEPYSLTGNGTPDMRRWRASEDQRRDETAPFRAVPTLGTSSAPLSDRWSTSANGATTGAFPIDSPDYDHLSPAVTMVERQAPSARGFFLGLLAFLLIAVVLGLYGWTEWLSADLRDAISGWFDFIG